MIVVIFLGRRGREEKVAKVLYKEVFLGTVNVVS